MADLYVAAGVKQEESYRSIDVWPKRLGKMCAELAPTSTPQLALLIVLSRPQEPLVRRRVGVAAKYLSTEALEIGASMSVCVWLSVPLHIRSMGSLFVESDLFRASLRQSGALRPCERFLVMFLRAQPMDAFF